jgi:hypothetical protein
MLILLRRRGAIPHMRAACCKPAPQETLRRARAASTSDDLYPDSPAGLEGRDHAGNPPFAALTAADLEEGREFGFREEFQFVARRGRTRIHAR